MHQRHLWMYIHCLKKGYHPTTNDNFNNSCPIPVIFGGFRYLSRPYYILELTNPWLGNPWFVVSASCPVTTWKPTKVGLWVCKWLSSPYRVSQFTKDMTCYHGNYDVRLQLCTCYWHSYHFTRSLRCLPATVPPFDQVHSTSTILPLMWRHLGRGRQPLCSAD